MSIQPIHIRVDATTHPRAADRVAVWRDAFSLSSEVAFTPDEADRFEGSMTFHHLGAVMLVDASYTAHTVMRDRNLIARTGREHVILDAIPSGGFSGIVGGRSITARPGDCFMMDLRGTMRLQLPNGRFIGVVIPRRLFEAQAGAASVHGLLFEAGSPQAGLLNPLLLALAHQAPRLTEAFAAAIGTSIVGLIAACVAPVAASPDRARPSPDTTLTRLRRHIERHAGEADLDPDSLCRHFSLSRTALYRLFQSEGGVADAIRRRRATLALRALTDRSAPNRPLGEVARASGFSDVRSLRRALQTVYGASPAELRRSPPETNGIASEHGVRIGGLLDSLVE